MPPRKTNRRQTPRSLPTRELPRVEPEDLADFNESINILVCGDSGVGKTPFAAMAPKAVILSTEKGSISAKRFGSQAKLMRCPTWEHVLAGLQYIDEHPDEFDWMVVDSLTKMQVLQIRWILERVHEENETRDLDIPAIADHQKWQNMFKRFVDRIIDMDVNVIFITTLMHKEDAEGDDLVMPDIQGKDYAIAQYVCQQMDGVYVLKAKTDKETGEPYWRLLTKFREPYFAKDRYDAFGGSVVERPTMPEIIKAIQASGEYQAAQNTKAKAKSKAAKVQDVEPDEDEEPAPRRGKGKTQAKAAKPTRGQSRARKAAAEPEPDEDEWEDDEDDPINEMDEDGRSTKTATSRRAKIGQRKKTAVESEDDELPAKTKGKAKKPAAKKFSTITKDRIEPEEDDDWFDPDTDEDDIDFDDEE